MTMLETFIKPMHREGVRFVAVFASVSLVLFLAWIPLGWVGTGLTIWCYYFFRDPRRATPLREGLIVSPADGVVSLIEPATPPEELGMGPEALTRISVFMSVFNCHVNRSPAAARVGAIAYHSGTFVNASLDKASANNERNGLCLELPDGRRIAVVQIAGLVARRIVCWAEKGQTLKAGERFGMIRFGSRLDVYLPAGVEPMVSLGQTMIAGETVLADLHADEPRRYAEVS